MHSNKSKIVKGALEKKLEKSEKLNWQGAGVKILVRKMRESNKGVRNLRGGD